MEITEIIDRIEAARQAGKTPAFAYDRISSEAQTDGMSLTYQEDSARRYAEYMKLDIIHTFSVVESARKAGRKVFNEMIDTALSCGIRNIIFKNTDRMSRNYSDLVRIEKLIDTEDFIIHFYQNNRIVNKDSNHNDRMILGIELVVAKHISDKASHDVRESYKFKAKSGIAPCKAPLGYTYNMNTKRFIIDPKKEPVVRQLFDEFDNGSFSLDEYCRLLNSRGITTSKGFPWTKQVLYRVITSPFYHGEFPYKGAIYDGTQDRYYDKKRYNDRIEKLKNAGNGRETKHEFALNGLLRCECGYAFYGANVKGGKYTYYIHNCPTAGKQVSIMESKAIHNIGLAVSRYLLDEQSAAEMKRIFAQTINEKSENLKSDLSGMNHQVAEVRAKKKRLFDLYADEGMDRDMLKESINELNTRQADLEKRIKTAEAYGDKVLFAITDIIENIRSFSRDFGAADDADRIAIIRKVVQGIKIDGELTTVYFKKPYSFILRPELQDLKQFMLAASCGQNETEHELLQQYFCPLSQKIYIESVIADVAEWIAA